MIDNLANISLGIDINCSTEQCSICPRKCKINRQNGERGFCGVNNNFKIAKYALHLWEEPPISFGAGSGAIFFSGCNLRCIYCQNKAVSRQCLGKYYSAHEVEQIMFSLKAQGAANINLVTPTQYTVEIIQILGKIKNKLSIPIVWNSSGYETKEALKLLDGLVDVYLPDYKYADPELAKKYSAAYDYPEIIQSAIKEMYSQVKKNVFDHNGKMIKGMIVRHLVLPGCRKNSLAVLEKLSELVPVENIKLSLMSQYTPDFAYGCGHKNLERRLTTFEYESVLERAIALGFDGYYQEKSSANICYTPKFDGSID